MAEAELVEYVVDAVRFEWFAGPREQADGGLQVPGFALKVAPVLEECVQIELVELFVGA